MSEADCRWTGEQKCTESRAAAYVSERSNPSTPIKSTVHDPRSGKTSTKIKKPDNRTRLQVLLGTAVVNQYTQGNGTKTIKGNILKTPHAGCF